MTDPLASPTLAQLYLAQGLHDRAHAILDQLLALDPDDGVALALRERLRIRTGAELEIHLDVESTGAREARIAAWVRWPLGGHPGDGPPDVVFALWSRGRTSPWITSRPVIGATTPRDARRRVLLDLPIALSEAGSATACLVTRAPGRPLEVVAVADPLSW